MIPMKPWARRQPRFLDSSFFTDSPNFYISENLIAKNNIDPNKVDYFYMRQGSHTGFWFYGYFTFANSETAWEQISLGDSPFLWWANRVCKKKAAALGYKIMETNKLVNLL
jgi:hypothetical protein